MSVGASAYASTGRRSIAWAVIAGIAASLTAFLCRWWWRSQSSDEAAELEQLRWELEALKMQSDSSSLLPPPAAGSWGPPAAQGPPQPSQLQALQGFLTQQGPAQLQSGDAMLPPPHGLPAPGGFGLPVPGGMALDSLAASSSMIGAAQNQHSTALPAEFRRAAGEIYTCIRREGVPSVRAWLKDNYTGFRGVGATQWADLWSMAIQVDMAVGQCRTDGEVMNLLLSDDRLEVALRHLGAQSYETRTGDKTGAAQMRAFATPGAARDVVPSWMVAEATSFSKAEFQRTDRVETEVRRRNPRTPKGKGKGAETERATKPPGK